MPTTIDFQDASNRSTVFVHDGPALRLVRLCGLECALNGAESGPDRTRGLLALETADGSCEADQFQVRDCRSSADRLEVRATQGASGLEWTSTWTLQAASGIWSRRDALANRSGRSVQVQRALLRFPFAPARLEFYAQGSSWAHENQGTWLVLPLGELSLRSQAGRTNQGASPYFFLRASSTDLGLAFHLLPQGDWVIHVDRSHTAGNPDEPFTVLELGLTDARLRLELAPGAALALPEVLIQPVRGGPEDGAAALHRHALERLLPQISSAPLVYNTWFDTFEVLEPARLEAQLAAAKEIGCEVFVVDAGWYGAGSGPWDRQVGDWREKPEAAFRGRMAAFAETVRAAGLGFGLWMEPERFAAASPALQSHPDWFLPAPWGYAYPDLGRPEVRDYLQGEMTRLIETYRLAWMKVDFNMEMGAPADGLSGYYREWYGLLDGLRARFPGTFFEGCASGGMRLDLNALSHFGGHFLSDTVNPLDVLRIGQGALLRLPPGRIARWAVLRRLGRSLPRYSLPLDQAPERVVTPGSAGWEDAFVAEADFVCRAALPGIFGFSGDLAGLSAATRARLRLHAGFYKRWRDFMTGSVAHLLTPVERLTVRSGWVAFQLQAPDGSGPNLVFAYRLDDGASRKCFPLRGLDPQRVYTVTSVDAPEAAAQFSGRELAGTGLPVELASRNSAGVYILQP